MRRWLFFLFVLFPALELWVLIQVGMRVGALATVTLVLLAVLLGFIILRLRGQHIAWTMKKEMEAGHIPANAVMDGFLLFVAAWLLIFPGFVSDIIGLLLIIPAVRRLLLRVGVERLRNYGMQTQTAHFSGTTSGGNWTVTSFGTGGGKRSNTLSHMAMPLLSTVSQKLLTLK